jgi:hypothetical protein
MRYPPVTRLEPREMGTAVGPFGAETRARMPFTFFWRLHGILDGSGIRLDLCRRVGKEQGSGLFRWMERFFYRVRVWTRRALNTVADRRRARIVKDALVLGINEGGVHDNQTLLRRLQFVQG